MKVGSNFRNVMTYKLVPHLDKAIEQGEFEWKADFKAKKPDDAFHPSGDCTPSLQALYLNITKQVPNEIKPSLYKTFTVGHFWHQYLQALMLEDGLCDEEAIEREGQTRWGLGPFEWAKGSGDVAPVKIPVHGEYLLDIKTMGSHDFNLKTVPNWTRDKWECQVNIYMDFFDIERAIILGVQKDSPHAFKEFEFERNQPLIDAIYLKWKIVSECYRNSVMPPPDEEIELPLLGPSI